MSRSRSASTAGVSEARLPGEASAAARRKRKAARSAAAALAAAAAAVALRCSSASWRGTAFCCTLMDFSSCAG